LKNNFRSLLMRKYGIKEPARLPAQQQIAADLDVSQATISLWLSEKVTRFDEVMLIKLCKGLGCSVGDLLNISEEREPA